MTGSVAIIGMPGSGKTTVGRELARISLRPFFDTDDMIKDQTGKSASRVISEQGEARFRELETQCLLRAVERPNCVISTGGGIVTRRENFAPLKDNCFVIQITRPLDALYIKNRPLSLQKGVYKLFEERAKLYDELCDAKIFNANSIQTARLIYDKWVNIYN